MTLKGRLTVEIAEVTPSLNQLVRMHWAKRRKLRPQYAWAVRAAASDAGWAVGGDMYPVLAPKMQVRITSYRAKTLDYDNLVGGMKPLVDALKDACLLRDDSPEWANISYVQVAGKERKTVVELEVMRWKET